MPAASSKLPCLMVFQVLKTGALEAATGAQAAASTPVLAFLSPASSLFPLCRSPTPSAGPGLASKGGAAEKLPCSALVKATHSPAPSAPLSQLNVCSAYLGGSSSRGTCGPPPPRQWPGVTPPPPQQQRPADSRSLPRGAEEEQAAAAAAPSPETCQPGALDCIPAEPTGRRSSPPALTRAISLIRRGPLLLAEGVCLAGS